MVEEVEVIENEKRKREENSSEEVEYPCKTVIPVEKKRKIGKNREYEKKKTQYSSS